MQVPAKKLPGIISTLISSQRGIGRFIGDICPEVKYNSLNSQPSLPKERKKPMRSNTGKTVFFPFVIKRWPVLAVGLTSSPGNQVKMIWS